ncbi:3-hydroxyacyl-ACP dehydratase FabZ family protein [Aureitalea marina]|uniref:Hydroxymyristoyl-ACP dehydratase n=1 Tax=Aureitalea marina TaxID=930804 RepID=A0A2S7KP33_9FLAO|nr:FabA/FabZ family ACP-dehydratase [Aureitalea marina]PQB04386.1 hydroxymyristoyl-ACP dehydratase [Aureitalea marina]
MNLEEKIVRELPYGRGFCFVDQILEVDEHSIRAQYHFDPHLSFYRDHFPDNPVTPGVILTECMAQVTLVCQGMYLLNSSDNTAGTAFALSESDVQFLLPVAPGTQVEVTGEVEYFRFNKLKTKARMYNESGELLCKATLSGMIVNKIGE